MRYEEFWKYLGNFWDAYESKETVNEMWGAWVALVANMRLQNKQINLSKNIKTIPIYWKELWVPFDTTDGQLTFDTLVNTVHEEAAVVVELDLDANIGSQYIIPGSITIRTEFGTPVALSHFKVDYWQGFIKLLDETAVSSGDQIVIEYTTAAGYTGVSMNISDGRRVKFNSEAIYGRSQDPDEPTYSIFTRLVRNRDYNINYSLGDVTLISAYNNTVIAAEFLNMEVDYPYKYLLPEKLHFVRTLYTNPRKLGDIYTLGTDFILEHPYIRFKTQPSESRLWAEEANFDMDNIYRVFGSAVGFLDDNSVNYYDAVYALTYYLQNPPTPKNLAGVCCAVSGLPIAIGGERVADIDISADTYNKVDTTLATYSLGKYLPAVHKGQTLEPITPLTDVIKIHDRMNSKDFISLLLYGKILRSDQGYIADNNLQADSMFTKAGLNTMFSPWHTFILEVKDPLIFENKEKINTIRWVLQSKPAYTTYLLLFSYYFNEKLQFPKTPLGIDWYDKKTEYLLGQPFRTELLPPEPAGTAFYEDDTYVNVSASSNGTQIEAARVSFDSVTRVLTIDGPVPNNKIFVTATRHIHGEDFPHPVYDWTYLVDGKGPCFNPIIGTKISEATPHDTTDTKASLDINYGNAVVPSTKSRFFGTDVMVSGKFLSPYSYSDFVVYDAKYDVIDPLKCSFNSKTYEMTVDDPGVDHPFVYVKALRTNKVSSATRYYTDRVILTDGVGLCFQHTVLFDTFKIFGLNMARGAVTWVAAAKSAYMDGVYSAPFHFNEQIARAYEYGKDFTIDELAGTITILPAGRMVEGQRVYMDYSYVDFDQHVGFPNTAITFTIEDETYNQGRELVKKNATQGIWSFEDTYWDGTPTQEQNDMLAACADIDNQWGLKQDLLPIGASIVPKYDAEIPQLDYLHTPAGPSDYDLHTRAATERFLNIGPDTYIGATGQAPYVHRYRLEQEEYFVTRLSSVRSTEDMSFGSGGFGTSPFGGMPDMKGQYDYFVEDHFIIRNTVNGRAIAPEIWFKDQPTYTYYHMFRFKPEDFSSTQFEEFDLGPANYLDNTGEGPYTRRYSVSQEYQYLDRLDFKTDTPDEMFSYYIDVDFVVDLWPQRVIRFKSTPSTGTYYVYQHNYYHYPRREDKVVQLTDPGSYINDQGTLPYQYRYLAPRKYSFAEILFCDNDRYKNYWIDKDYIVHYNDPADGGDGTVEFRFRVRPTHGSYHTYHSFYRHTEFQTNEANREFTYYWDSLDQVTMLRWLNADMDAYITEREYPEEVEIRAARSYVDRSDWHGSHYWCGPGVPFGGWAPRPSPEIPGSTLAPIAIAMP